MFVVPAFAQEPGFKINAGVTTQYQSNIFALSQANKFIAQVDSVADILFQPELRLGYDMPISLQTLQIAVRAGYSLHHFNSRLDDIDAAASVGLRWALGGRCSGVISTNYTAAPGKLEDALAESRTREDSFSFAGSANCAITPKGQLQFSARQAYSSNDSLIFSANDINDTYLQARMAYTGSNDFRPFIGARLRWLSQPRNVATGSFASGIDSYVQEFGAGGEWSPSSYITINAEGYYTDISGTVLRESPISFTGNSSITWQYSSKITTKVSAAREVQSSIDVGTIAYGVTSLNAEIIWKSTPRIDGSLVISYDHRNAKRVVRGLAGMREVRDNSFRWELSLLYRLTPLLDVKVAAKHRWRNASFDALTYRNTGISAQLLYSWPSIN